MTSSDVDINLLHLKLNALEERVKVLESMNKFPMQTATTGDAEFINERPTQWPNESFTDYLKRIGEYSQAYGENK